MDFMDFDPEMPMPTTEKNAIPLDCWHNVKKLADIWIPSLLLPNRNRPSNMRVPQGIYHTLEKRDSSKYSKSFSVYSYLDNDDEFDEIYVSDSEDNNFSSYSSGFEKVESCDNTLPVIADSVRSDNIASGNDLGKITESNVSKKKYETETNGVEDKFKELNTLNKNTSLEDILDNNTEISIKNFEFCFKKDDDEILSLYGTKEKKIKKNKKDKVKKKTSKYVKIDNFFETDTDANTHAQDYYADKYCQELLNEKPQNNHSSSVPVEFPDLTFHSDKTTKENDVPIFNNLRTELNKSGEINKNKNIVDVQEIGQSLTDSSPGKIVIENIPADVTRDEVLCLLDGYGEIKAFSLVSAGNFFTAYVEVDLISISDIDWIVDCLNGSEPFGAYNTKLRCYKA